MKSAPKFSNFGREREITHSHVLLSVEKLNLDRYLGYLAGGQILQEQAHVLTALGRVTMISRFLSRYRA